MFREFDKFGVCATNVSILRSAELGDIGLIAISLNFQDIL